MQIGQHVVLVDDKWRFERKDMRGGVRYPVRGVVYTVRGIFDPVQGEGDAITLVEIVNPVLGYRLRAGGRIVAERRFRASRFKPLAKLKIEDFVGVREPA